MSSRSLRRLSHQTVTLPVRLVYRQFLEEGDRILRHGPVPRDVSRFPRAPVRRIPVSRLAGVWMWLPPFVTPPSTNYVDVEVGRKICAIRIDRTRVEGIGGTNKTLENLNILV